MHASRNAIPSVCLLAGLVILLACTSAAPPNRISDYLGAQAANQRAGLDVHFAQPLEVGLLLISDTAAPGAAPALLDEVVNRLGEDLVHEIGRTLPLRIKQVISSKEIGPGGDLVKLSELGRKLGTEYLLVAVLSGTEVEYPMTLFLGWTAHSQPGLRVDNWSLIEVALLRADNGQVLLQAEGRGWATLDMPMAPGINQWYPVIWRRPADPNRRWFPSSYVTAPTELREISMKEAATRVVLSLLDALGRPS